MPDFLRDTPLFDFAIALFIGALVGIEREKKQAEEHERGIGGLRTFILFAATGAVAAFLSRELATPWLFIATGAFVSAIVLVGYGAWVRAHPADVGVTTESAALVVYLLGGLAVLDHEGLAVALAIATSAVLAFKQPLHGLVDRLGRDDLYAGLKLLIATFIVLPVLPDRTLDPWGALNPYKMWWLVILISGLSLLGYAATRWLGSGRGVPITGLFGGLVSSTAVTLTFAKRSREAGADTALVDSLAAGVLIAWLVMFVRIAAMIAAVDLPLVRPLVLPLAGLTAISAGTAVLALRRAGEAARRSGGEVPLSNPFSLTSAIRFAALFAAVLLVVKLVQQYAPGRGLYAVAALAGLTDVDAITLSMAGGARAGSIESGTALGAILIAALSNTFVKLGFAVSLGAPALARWLAIATVGLVVVGGAALVAGF